MASGRSSALKYISSRVFRLPLTMALEEMNSMDTTPTPPIRRTIRRKSRSVTPAIGASQRGGSTRTVPSCTMARDCNAASGPELPASTGAAPRRAADQEGGEGSPLETAGEEAPEEQRAAVELHVAERAGEVEPGDHGPPQEEVPPPPDPEDGERVDDEADRRGSGDGSAGGLHVVPPRSAASRKP